MKQSDYELFKHYKEEFLFLKTRLMGMDFNDNPVKKDVEYNNILVEENKELKDEVYDLRLELSKYRVFNQYSLWKKIIYLIKNKTI